MPPVAAARRWCEASHHRHGHLLVSPAPGASEDAHRVTARRAIRGSPSGFGRLRASPPRPAPSEDGVAARWAVSTVLLDLSRPARWTVTRCLTSLRHDSASDARVPPDAPLSPHGPAHEPVAQRPKPFGRPKARASGPPRPLERDGGGWWPHANARHHLVVEDHRHRSPAARAAGRARGGDPDVFRRTDLRARFRLAARAPPLGETRSDPCSLPERMSASEPIVLSRAPPDGGSVARDLQGCLLLSRGRVRSSPSSLPQRFTWGRDSMS